MRIRLNLKFQKLWSIPNTRKKLLEELNDKGYVHDQLEDLRKLVHCEDSNLYGVPNYVVYH